jgi:hypothetical protein
MGEDFGLHLVAEAALVKLAERRDGAQALQEAFSSFSRLPLSDRSHGPVPHVSDPDGFYRRCLERIVPGWASGHPNIKQGWFDVLHQVAEIPPLSGTPGSDGIPTCRSDGHGNWDIVMALAMRVWGLVRDETPKVLPMTKNAVEGLFPYSVWLQGSPSPLDDSPCSFGPYRMPETENHTWLIRTTRFLHNESLDIVDTNTFGNSEEDVRNYDVDQNANNDTNGLTNILLNTMRDWVHHDFLEYNSNPYSRFQMIGLLNLYDFAHDDRVRRAAQVTLDFIASKVGAESMTGLRMAPFRRRWDLESNRLFDHDPVNPMFQVWTGGLAPQAVVDASYGGEMALAASSDYRPPDVLVDVMLNPAHHDYMQQFDGRGQQERAYGTRDFTLTGGGFSTDCPYPTPDLPLVGYPERLLLPNAHCLGSGNDKGSVEPIVLLPWLARDAKLPCRQSSQ